MRRTSTIIAGLAALALTAACAQPTGEPSTGSAYKQEASQSRRMLAELEKRDLIEKDRSLNRYIGEISERIARQRPRSAPRMRVYVVRDGDVNAFTTGAGYIFLNAGLIAVLENEAQLANVVAHEAAHVDRGHVAAGAQNRSMIGLGAAATAFGLAVMGVPGSAANAIAGTGAQVVNASYTREQESDADAIGFRYLSGGGYNAVAGAKSFKVLRRLYGNGGGFLSTHPENAERQKMIASLARKRGADQGRVAAKEYLDRTREIRKAALKTYKSEGRAAEARQAERNLRERKKKR